MINKFAAGFFTLDVIVGAPNLCVNLFVVSRSLSVTEIIKASIILIYVLFVMSLQCWYCNKCNAEVKWFFLLLNNWSIHNFNLKIIVLTLFNNAKHCLNKNQAIFLTPCYRLFKLPRYSINSGSIFEVWDPHKIQTFVPVF